MVALVGSVWAMTGPLAGQQPEPAATTATTANCCVTGDCCCPLAGECCDPALRGQSQGVAKAAKILDVGGGDSLLVDELISRGYSEITVVDLSMAALDRARARLGREAAGRVAWLQGDILDVSLTDAPFDVWHDRAVFHFLTSAAERHAYIERVEHSVHPGGHVIVATFSEDGPTRCSGLPVVRYSAAELHGAFGSDFQLIASEREAHRTPTGVEQGFTYCWCRYEPIAVETR
jgi:2-polyprenyl-3-methyl-5-hydroxy-6-metoxy-1,4-benzoquinol methylase